MCKCLSKILWILPHKGRKHSVRKCVSKLLCISPHKGNGSEDVRDRSASPLGPGGTPRFANLWGNILFKFLVLEGSQGLLIFDAIFPIGQILYLRYPITAISYPGEALEIVSEEASDQVRWDNEKYISKLLLGAPEKSVSIPIPCGQEGLDRNIWVGERSRKRNFEKCEAWRRNFEQKRAWYQKLSKKSNKVHQDRDPSQTSWEEGFGNVFLRVVLLLHVKVILLLFPSCWVEGELFGDWGDAREPNWVPVASIGGPPRRLMVF